MDFFYFYYYDYFREKSFVCLSFTVAHFTRLRRRTSFPPCLFEVMADAFGDDLFSVFDEEQAGSSKKATPKSAAQAGYANERFVLRLF